MTVGVDMDESEPPRRLSAESRFRDAPEVSDDPRVGRPRRFPRGDRPWNALREGPVFSGRRLAVLAAGLGLAGFVGLVAVGTIRRGLRSYVHSRDVYQLSSQDVILDPPPPAWFRGGAATFLERVWGRTSDPRVFSLLDVDQHQLALLFRREPWVARVDRVSTHFPNRVVVALEYRRPVAVAMLADQRKVLVDREGVVLSSEDIELDRIDLVGLANFNPPDSARYGEVWLEPEFASLDRVGRAARLAEFIQVHRETLDSAMTSPYFLVLQPFGERDLYLQVTGGKDKDQGDSLMFRWNDSSKGRSAPVLSDRERWAMLREWLKQHPPGRSGRRFYLIFTPRGVEDDPAPFARTFSRVKA